MSIRLTILDAGGHFGRRRALIGRTIESSIAYVSRKTRLDEVDIVVQSTDFGPDQYPIRAFTMSSHNVHIGIERSALSWDELETELHRTVVHELHHALRWRHVPRWTLGEALTLEGLAVLADGAAAGTAEDMRRPLARCTDAMAYVSAHRGEPVLRHDRWLYSSEPEQPGAALRVYTAGRHLMRASLRALRITPWTAALRSADELIDAGLARLAVQTA